MVLTPFYISFLYYIIHNACTVLQTTEYKLKRIYIFHFFKIINLINIPILLFVYFFVLHPLLSNYVCIKKST